MRLIKKQQYNIRVCSHRVLFRWIPPINCETVNYSEDFESEVKNKRQVTSYAESRWILCQVDYTQTSPIEMGLIHVQLLSAAKSKGIRKLFFSYAFFYSRLQKCIHINQTAIFNRKRIKMLRKKNEIHEIVGTRLHLNG